MGKNKKSSEMSKELAIQVEGLSKKFIQKDGTEFWALNDVSFEVKKGEVLGILGANGSGKSTLLNILSEIIRPTKGSAIINGNCSSVLDVGSGFHPDLTGKENIFFKGSMLGMREAEIANKFQEIVDFSELGKFIHEPIKSYSNGMFLRLAFSISISLSYDIILLDEVLAVGDLSFREKCRQIIENEVKNEKTIVIVSHSLEEIRKLASRCVLLENGRLVLEDSTENVIEEYRVRNEETPLPVKRTDNAGVEILDCIIRNTRTGKSVSTVFRNEGFEIVIRVKKTSHNTPLELMMTLVNNVDVQVLSDSMTFREDYQYTNIEAGDYVYSVRVPGGVLNKDTYRVQCMCSSNLEMEMEPEFVRKIKVLPESWETQFSWFDQHAVTRPVLDWRIKNSSGFE
jgi:lipopolysaccharide transport system ATP-binding protein